VSGDLREKIRRYLEAHATLTLATCDGDLPWAAALFFASDAQFNLYFVSSPQTRHAQHIARNAHVAATVNEDYRDWREIQGLQIEGRAEMVDEADREQVAELYLAKFPSLRPMFSAPRDDQERRAAEQLAESRFYRVASKRIRLIDNTQGFGHREELDVDSGASLAEARGARPLTPAFSGVRLRKGRDSDAGGRL
jgi:hypothetical protein